jgi:hypothetical protein
MKRTAGISKGCRFSVVGVILVGWFSAFANYAQAQGNQGQNAVCTSSSGCSTTIGTSAFIDASVFLNPVTAGGPGFTEWTD